jgi:hypothetical protein
MPESFVRVLIQHVIPTGEGPMVSKEQPTFQLKVGVLTTTQVRDKINAVLATDADEAEADLLRGFLGEQQA